MRLQCKKTRSKEKDQIGERNSEYFDKKKEKEKKTVDPRQNELSFKDLVSSKI